MGARMPVDLTTEYVDARNVLEQIKEEVERQLAVLQRDVSALANGKWKETMFDNADVGGFPAELAHTLSACVDVGRSPAIAEIAAGAQRYHGAWHKATEAWHQLSDSQRSGLSAPKR